MKGFNPLIVLVLLVAVWASCEQQDPASGKLSISVVSDLVCKGGFPLKGSDPAPESSCIDYQYDGDSLLVIRHLNAGFNCQPGLFAVDIEVSGDSLIIREDDEKHAAKCNCLYDLEITVRNLPSASYHVRIAEPYVNALMPRLIFDLNLKKEPTGQFCVTRNEGWWR